MSKQFWGVIAVVVAALVGLLVFTGKSSAPTNSASSGVTNHVRGSEAKTVTLVEYGDFQCPFCGQYFPTLEQVYEQYKGDVTFQFRHFPLTNLHKNGFAASRAAEAAGLQDKFYEMYTVLYQNQQSWSESDRAQSTFENYAKQIGLDVSKFKADYASTRVNAAINADMAAGNKLGVQGTPTFFLDGKQVTINNTVDAFKKALDAELAKKNKTSSGSSDSLNQINTPVSSEMPAPGSTTPEMVAPSPDQAAQ